MEVDWTLTATAHVFAVGGRTDCLFSTVCGKPQVHLCAVLSCSIAACFYMSIYCCWTNKMNGWVTNAVATTPNQPNTNLGYRTSTRLVLGLVTTFGGSTIPVFTQVQIWLKCLASLTGFLNNDIRKRLKFLGATLIPARELSTFPTGGVHYPKILFTPLQRWSPLDDVKSSEGVHVFLS